MALSEKREMLKEQDSIADMLNDCSIDRVMAIDLNWNIISWNSTSELLSGITKTEVLGKNLLQIFPQIQKDKETMAAIHAALEGKKSFLPANSNSFNRNYSENHFIPLKDQGGRVIGVMNIIHDVAHRLKVEKQLQKLNNELQKRYHQLEKANNELARFTYITSRDIKEPLKHVYTSLELLVKKEGPSLSNMSKGNLRRMQGSLNKMNLLLDDIVTVSSISSNNETAELVDLNTVLADAAITLKSKLDEKLAVIESDHLPVITGFKKMLDYLFVNIIDNAVKFQPENTIPKVRISATTETGEQSGINELAPDTEYVHLSFTDNGIGFNQSDAERIFGLFERLHDRKYHGSGTGLTICRKIAEAHDGLIFGDSTEGNGATFHCYLPLTAVE